MLAGMGVALKMGSLAGYGWDARGRDHELDPIGKSQWAGAIAVFGGSAYEVADAAR